MKKFVPTTLSSSKLPQPSFACWWPSFPFRREQTRVLTEVFAVHNQVLPVHVDEQVDRIHACIAHLLDREQRHADVAHENLHRRFAVLVLQKDLDAARVCVVHQFRDRRDEARPCFAVGPLKGIVVPFGTGPNDEVRLQLACEVNATLQRVNAPAAQGVVRVDERAELVGRIGMQARRDHGQIHAMRFQNAVTAAMFSSLISPG